ncbi:hypothetical protein M3649_21755 [Ureibacillus chungkukjangi]|uniref:hypothetical protein n=1 Tax=Ureibacillus chungkukjangi TaxID=1202712 RepID=UPI00203EDB75|nr:hypothetical protein [Ureibacillus chungkukjangi]MCM3390709.1 hypothetical protein [Ureibacillus chungkukjangi]
MGKIIIGIVLLIIIIMWGLIIFFPNQKNKEKNEAIDKITKKFKLGKNSKDATLLGTSSLALSLYDIYASTKNHEEVLNIIEQRYPNAVKDYDSFDWYTKINDLNQNGTVDSYVSAYAGQKAENYTVEFFNSQGSEAKLFESRTHENNDVRVFNEDGSYIDYSVKSLGSVSHFKQEVIAHPESTHYVVNKELYDELNQTGELVYYQNQGITIIRGNYSNSELREEGKRAFDEIFEAGDIADNIPIIASVLLGLKVTKNYKKYRLGTQSGGEFKMNLVSDTFRAATSGSSGFLGAKLGAFILASGGPITAIIGGGVGAILATYGGAKLVNFATSRLKWSSVFKAQSHFGMMNKEKIKYVFLDSAADKVFLLNELENELAEEKRLLKKYEGELDDFSDKPVTVPAILCDLHVNKLTTKINNIKESFERTRIDLLTLSEKMADKLTINILEKNQLKIKIYGEVFLSSSELFDDVDLDSESEHLKFNYMLNKAKNPNYPTRLPNDSTEILTGLLIRNFNILSNKTIDYKKPIKSNTTWSVFVNIVVASSYFISLLNLYLIHSNPQFNRS